MFHQFNSFKLPSIKVTSGQPVTKVLSSKFCHGRILQAFSQVPSTRLITSEWVLHYRTVGTGWIVISLASVKHNMFILSLMEWVLSENKWFTFYRIPLRQIFYWVSGDQTQNQKIWTVYNFYKMLKTLWYVQLDLPNGF